LKQVKRDSPIEKKRNGRTRNSILSLGAIGCHGSRFLSRFGRVWPTYLAETFDRVGSEQNFESEGRGFDCWKPRAEACFLRAEMRAMVVIAVDCGLRRGIGLSDADFFNCNAKLSIGRISTYSIHEKVAFFDVQIDPVLPGPVS
jgi:hypothetical protein